MKKLNFVKTLTASLLLLSALPAAHAIVNGERVKSKTVIAQGTVSLYNRVTETFCTGTIIDPHWVLTAAHCLTTDFKTLLGKATARDITVIFGEFDSAGGNLGNSTRASFVLSHPDFKGMSTVKTPERADVALVRFDSKLPKKAKVIPVLSDTDFHAMTPGTEVILAGYGMTSLKDNSTRKRLYSFATTYQSTDDQARVARLVPYQNKPGGNCPGDSGGPAFLNVQGQLFVWGVASTAHQSCEKYGDYGNITHFADWVSETMAQNPAQ